MRLSERTSGIRFTLAHHSFDSLLIFTALLAGCKYQPRPSNQLAENMRPFATEPKPTDSSSRKYYNELYEAGGLDNFDDSYVCLPDEDNGNFFLIAKSDVLSDFLLGEPGSTKLPAKQRKELLKGFLMRTAYNKGIAGGREYLDIDKESGSYFEEFQLAKLPAVLRLTVNWQTLRYRLAVGKKGQLPSAQGTGRCESVAGGVHQHGSPESNP